MTSDLLICITAKKQPQTLTEWLSAFLEAELAAWDNALDYEQDDYDDHDAAYFDTDDDFDSDILESLVILALAGALAFLLWYRSQRQRRQEEDRRRREQLGGGAGADQVGGAGGDRGVFPNPGDPEFLNWVAGGVGH